MVKLAQLNDKTLVGLEVSQWDGVGDQVVSIDNGNSWMTISRSLQAFGDNKTDLSLPAKMDDNRFVSLGRTQKKDRTKKTLNIITNKFENLSQRKTWKYHYPAKKNCETMLPQLTHDTTLYFLCDQGQIVSTDNFGKTWNVEIDIDIVGMQSKYEALLNALKNSTPKEEN